MDLDLLDIAENTLQFVAHVGADLPEKYEHIVQLPEKGRRERASVWKSGEDILILRTYP